MSLAYAKLPLVTLVPLGNITAPIPEFLSLALTENLAAKCTIWLQHYSLPNEAYHPQRRQYDAMELMVGLLTLQKQCGGILLGLTDQDIFLPILTYVFGAAQLGGPIALCSTHRLCQEFYGLPGNQRLMLERIEKEAIHELGHVRGLLHCQQPQCAMYPAHSVDQIDNRPADLCPGCLQHLT